MNFSDDLTKLSSDFLENYPANVYPELLCKAECPFTYLCIDIHCGYYICIPFRSNISHHDAFLLQDSKSGLDYTKIILVNKKAYLDSQDICVNQDQYNEVRENILKIVIGAVKYIDDYIWHVTGVKPMHQRDFVRRYRYSTLPYFHDIMHIERGFSASLRYFWK